MPYILIIIKLKLTYFRWKEYEIEIYLFIQLNGTIRIVEFSKRFGIPIVR